MEKGVFLPKAWLPTDRPLLFGLLSKRKPAGFNRKFSSVGHWRRVILCRLITHKMYKHRLHISCQARFPPLPRVRLSSPRRDGRSRERSIISVRDVNSKFNLCGATDHRKGHPMPITCQTGSTNIGERRAKTMKTESVISRRV